MSVRTESSFVTKTSPTAQIDFDAAVLIARYNISGMLKMRLSVLWWVVRRARLQE